jgi:O-succinylbenzoate synthase
MRIDRVELFHLGLPLVQPVAAPGGDLDRLETVLVALHAGDAVGWGEASPGTAPLSAGEWAAGTFAVLRDWLAPRVTGVEIDSGDTLGELLAPFQGNRFAKGALDAAWWDLRARREEKPLWQMIGGERERIEVGGVLDRMESTDDFLARLRAMFDEGYARMKLMVYPGWDLRMVEAVRRDFGAERIHIDPAGSMSLGQMDTLYRMDDFMLEFIEQPLPADDLVGHAMVAEAISTAVGLDESISDADRAAVAIELHSGRYVNLRADRTGGLTAAAAVHQQCREAEIDCFVGGAPQTSIGWRAAMALASLPGCTYPSDFQPSGQLLAADIAEPLVAERAAAAGTLHVPLWSTPGLGAVPDVERLAEFTLERAECVVS